MVEGRIKFSCPARLSEVTDVPDINAVVIVNTGQPAVRGVKCHSYCIRVASIGPAGEQLTKGRRGGNGKSSDDKLTHVCVCQCVCLRALVT